MATCLLRLTVHDPDIVRALDALRGARKQSAFVVAALRHYLRTEEGAAQLGAFLCGQHAQREVNESKMREEPAVAEVREKAKTSKTNLDDIFG